MHIRRLHIGDFGIFRNQTLEDVHPGVVVIGGANRAGKSTFMQALRYLGYGIPSGGSLPPANVEYMIEGDIWDEKTHTDYHIRLEGQSEPVCIIGGKGQRIAISDIYKLDAFTYHNLFTISLDQLTRVPKGVSKNEFDKLQAALLGAGLTDIANIPRLEEGFSKSAAAIGGSTGRLSNKGFRPYVEFIREGVNKKKKALGQVEEYQSQQNHLANLTEEEEELNSKLREQYAKRDLLEAVKGNYDMLEELIELDHILPQHKGGKVSDDLPLKNLAIIEALLASYQDLRSELGQEYEELAEGLSNQEGVSKLIELLLKYRASLQNHLDKLSGLEVRWDHLRDLKWNLEENRQDVIEKIQGLHKNWSTKDIVRIRELPLEFLEENRLMKLVSHFQNLENQLERTDTKLEEVQANAEGLQIQKLEWENQASIPFLKKYFGISTLFVLLGLALSFVHFPSGLLVGLLGILGAALVAFYKGIGQKDAQTRLKEIQGQLSSALDQLEKLHGKRVELADELGKLESELTGISEMLGLEEMPAPVSLMEYYRGLIAIQEGIQRLDRQESDLSEQTSILASQFQGIHSLISQFEGLNYNNFSKDQLEAETWMEIQNAVRKWNLKLKIAIRIENLSLEMKKTKTRILHLIGLNEEMISREDELEALVGSYIDLCECRSDFLEKENRRMLIRQSLERVASSKGIAHAVSVSENSNSKEGISLQVLFNIFYEYPVRESIEREYGELMIEINSLEDELKSCRKGIQKANIFLEQLSLTDQLEQAHAMINKGRSGLYQESYRYAVYKTAAWMCREIRNRFLDKTKDELLIQSEDILKQLTGGDYRRIFPKENLSDFSFTLENGAVQDNSSILSRGTVEQVFLAIRLGRILDSNSGLPVIIDDSLVNFDAAHLKRALAIIAKLSQSHQVFIMTCQPHLVDLLMDMDISSQYWMLNNGRFSLTNGPILSETLHFSSISC
ncbi:MAG: AAA family ATPase [Clostridiales bacterium]|nr:AAA family ATPase [Clostridiales bacterium]